MKRLKPEQKKYFYLGITLFISLSLVVIVSTFFQEARIVVTLIKNIFGALSAVWIGIIIAYLINPIVKFFETKVFLKLFKNKHKGLARALSVVLSIVLLLAFLIFLLLMIIPQLVETIYTLVRNVPSYWSTLESWIKGFAEANPTFGEPILNFLDGAYDKLMIWLQHDLLPSANLLGTATGALMGAVSVLMNFFIGLIVSIYLLCDKENFLMQTKKVMAATFSKRNYTRILNVCSETHHVFGEFITGKILDSLLVGAVTFVFMWIADIPYATLVSVLLAVCNLIPIFGMFIGIIPSALLILVIDPFKAVLFVVVIVIYMQIDGNVISPKILGESIGLKSFWILFSIILFGGLFGVVGMLIGVPVFAMIYRYVTFLMNKRLKKKNLPQEAYAYAGGPMDYPPTTESPEGEKTDETTDEKAGSTISDIINDFTDGEDSEQDKN
ncbi:MAG: AI-2E family transporter [Eubacterium sp.]|nr:AI-2E family transporter [Eubacterium sp.]